MNARWQTLADWLNALETKERVLLSVVTVLVLGMLLLHFGIDPLQRERRNLRAEIDSIESRTHEAEQLGSEIVAAAKRDPDLAVRTQLVSLDEELARYTAEIRERAGELIPPNEIPLVLRRVLEGIDGLEFAGMEGLGAEPLLEQSADTDPSASSVNAYRHGFRISFKGSYLDTIAYLRALEALPWRLFWDAVDIEVEAHPRASVSVVVYTLSLDRRWIGV